MQGTTLSHVLVDTGSSLNVLPKNALDRLDCEGLILKPRNIIVRAFDGSKRIVHEEVSIPIKIGTHTFDSIFYVMDIRPSYSCLLGRPWIHGASAVTSTLQQMLKYPIRGKIVTVHGEEEYMVSHLTLSGMLKWMVNSSRLPVRTLRRFQQRSQQPSLLQ